MRLDAAQLSSYERIASMIEDIKKTLWATADKLRANMDAAEYKHIVLGLIFVKYISDTFQTRRDELTRRFGDPSDDYFLHDVDAELLADELEDRDYYKEVNVFWVPEAARWETLRAQAKQADIGKRIDDALSLIEVENPKLKGILDKRYARVQLPDGKLGELVDLVSTIGFGETGDTAKNHARDLLGQVYEYFLGQFASAEGKRGGQFYTPASIVKTLVAVLAPHHGKVYDPCCGSGGMFVQSERFIEAHGGKIGDVSIYGQEANPTTWRLAAMNLAIRGIDFNLGKEPADTFVRDQHADLRADFVLANPPFNISDWWHGSLEGDPRWLTMARHRRAMRTTHGFSTCCTNNYKHKVVQAPRGKAGTEIEPFKWLNIVLGNLKTALSGTHHAFKFAKYARRYLAEVQYRFNRRSDLASMVPRLATAVAQTRPCSARRILGKSEVET